MPMPQISPAEAKRQLDAGSGDVVLLDVRRPDELVLARIPGAVHVPMDEIPKSLDQLDRETEYVVMCHHGIRSGLVCNFLRARGYPKVTNLRGGIDAWHSEVDPSIGRY